MWWWLEERLLERRFRRGHRFYEKQIRKLEAKKNRGPGELDWLLQEASDNEAMALDELNSKSGQHLLHRARMLGLATPPFKSDAYEEGLHPNTYRLTPEARAQLRRLIREEKKARRDEWSGSLKDIAIPIVLALTGLMGAAIGLVSVLRSK
jgi:hypothetical protein